MISAPDMPFDHGVVDLRQQRHVATAQPVDEVGLPQGA